MPSPFAESTIERLRANCKGCSGERGPEVLPRAPEGARPADLRDRRHRGQLPIPQGEGAAAGLLPGRLQRHLDLFAHPHEFHRQRLHHQSPRPHHPRQRRSLPRHGTGLSKGGRPGGRFRILSDRLQPGGLPGGLPDPPGRGAAGLQFQEGPDDQPVCEPVQLRQPHRPDAGQHGRR